MADPAMDHGLKVEQRLIVKGWRNEAGKRREFTSSSPLYCWSSVEFEEARIGEKGLSDWQPHITAVVVEERVVSPWRLVRETPAVSGG